MLLRALRSGWESTLLLLCLPALLVPLFVRLRPVRGLLGGVRMGTHAQAAGRRTSRLPQPRFLRTRVGEFDFAHAIAAYEAVIDLTCAGRTCAVEIREQAR